MDLITRTEYQEVVQCLSLVRLNRNIRARVMECLTTAFDPSPALSSFVPAAEFRLMQAEMNFLIGGNFAYHFLRDGLLCQSWEMDLYIAVEHTTKITGFLMFNGYQPQLTPAETLSVVNGGPMPFDLDDKRNHDYDLAWRFIKHYEDVDGQPFCRVIVVTATRTTPLSCILNSEWSKFSSSGIAERR